MADIIHDTLLHHLVTGTDWQTADVRAALFAKTTWTPDPGDAVLADVTGNGAVEVAAASYVRVAVASRVANTDSILHEELLSAAVIDFGTLEAGSDYDTLVLYVFVTDDSDSWLATSIDVGAQVTDGTDERFVPDPSGLIAFTPGVAGS